MEDIVNDIINSPQLRGAVENFVRSRTAADADVNNSAINPGARPNTTNVGLNVPSTSSTPIDELRRLYPTMRSRSRQLNSSYTRPSNTTMSQKRQKHFKNDAFHRDIILLENINTKRTLLGREKARAYEEGFAFQNCELKKSWNEQKIQEEIYKIFNAKLDNHIQFDFLVPMGGHLVAPTTTNLNGETISKLYYNKVIYIRAITPLKSNTLCEEDNYHNINTDTTLTIETENEDANASLTDAINFDVNNDNLLDTATAIDTPIYFDVENNNLINTLATEETDSTISEPQSLSDILKKLQSYISEEHTTYFNIFREDVFNCCLRALRRKSFSPYHKISVVFTDSESVSEGAIDAGGPLREMFRLILNYLHESRLFGGPEHQKYISLNKDAFVRDEYYEAGRLIAMSIVHTGCGPHFFSNFLFRLITSKDNVEPTVDDVIDTDIQEEIKMIINANDMYSLRNILIESVYLKVAGWETITDFKNKEYLIKDVIHFYAIERNEKCLSRLTEGLKTLNVYENMKSYPEYFIELMCDSSMRLLCAAMFDTVFKIYYSPDGHNKRRIESRVIAFWKDYLIECEGFTCRPKYVYNEECALEEILIFCTGAKTIPVLGFANQPTIYFLHGDSSRFPKGNTCGLELYLPTIHTEYDKFKEDMTFGIKNGLVFGYA